MIDPKTEKVLKEAGLLRGKYDDYRKMYNAFKDELHKTDSRMQAYTNVSERMGFSEVTVQRAVKAMSKL